MYELQNIRRLTVTLSNNSSSEISLSTNDAMAKEINTPCNHKIMVSNPNDFGRVSGEFWTIARLALWQSEENLAWTLSERPDCVLTPMHQMQNEW